MSNLLHVPVHFCYLKILKYGVTTDFTVKEGPADCIRINEVAAALKKMKRQPQACQG